MYKTLDEIHQDLQRGILSWDEAKAAMKECEEMRTLAMAAGMMAKVTQ